MKIELSQKAIMIIREELQMASRRCVTELASLPLYQIGSPVYLYWEARYNTIEDILKEMHENKKI